MILVLSFVGIWICVDFTAVAHLQGTEYDTEHLISFRVIVSRWLSPVLDFMYLERQGQGQGPQHQDHEAIIDMRYRQSSTSESTT